LVPGYRTPLGSPVSDAVIYLRIRKGAAMNWDQVEGNWKSFKGRVREQWGKLTDDDLDVVAGKREQLAGKIQERYGIAREVADRQVNDWLSNQREDTPV
jgi:uncharacterized protein YjbJ (UPF0337 family)